MLELFYTCVKCTLNTKNPLLPPQKSVKVDLIQENTGSFTTKKLLFSYEKYENAYVKRGVTVNPTIYDVSRLSGVSIATVSRAFSNPERVREDTRRKVFEAAEVLHYSPNAIARAMARQRTDKIAFLICKEGATILDEFYAGICTGIMRETNRSDFELVISTAADWDTASNTSKNKQVEGVILGGNARPDMIAELQNRDLAVVLVNNRIQGLDDSSACGMLEPELTSVHIDCRRMGELSVARLQALLAGETDVPQVTVVPTELRVRGSS